MIYMEFENVSVGKKKNYFLIAIALIVLLNSFLIFQTQENSIISGFDKKIVMQDDLPNPVLSKFSSFISLVSNMDVGWLLVFLLLNIFILLFYFAIRNYSDSNVAFFSSIVLIFSPTHLFFNSSFNLIFLLELIIVLIFLLFSFKNKILVSIGFFLLICASFLNPVFFIVLAILTIFSIWRKEEFRKTKLFFLLIFALCVIAYYIIFGGIKGQLPDYPMHSFLDFLFEFSLIFGVILISIILAVVNFFIGSYKDNQKKIIALFLMGFAMIFFSLYYVSFLNIVTSALCGATICFIVFRKWEILTVKVTTFFIIMLLIVYSCAQLFYFLSIAPPSFDVLSELRNMNEAGFDFSRVISHPLYEVYIREISQNKGFYEIGSSQYLSRDFKDILSYWNQSAKFDSETLQNLNNFFYSRSIDKTLNAGKFLEVDYVLITNEMRNGLTWEKKEEGLLFVIRNKEVFERLIDDENITLIKINYDGINSED